MDCETKFFPCSGRRFLDLVLPNPQDSPAHAPHLRMVPPVTPAVRLDLGLPLLGQLVSPQREAPSVPEVAIDEHRKSQIPEREVWTAGEVAGMTFGLYSNLVEP